MQIGVDIGGTFTDIVALDRDGPARRSPRCRARRRTCSRASAPPSRSVLALAGARARLTSSASSTAPPSPPTPMLEQKGAVTAILTTEGFEDVLELGRHEALAHVRPRRWTRRRPTFLAPRRRRVGDPRAAGRPRPRARPAGRGRTCARRCRRSARRASQAIAVCYLFSFVNPAHERRTREIVARAGAGDQRVALVRGRSDLPRVRAPLRDRLRRLPRPGGEALPGRARRHAARPRRPRACRSSCGRAAASCRRRWPREQPVTLFLSGPAGGVIGARFAAERSGVRDFVSLDMGGTSNDVAVVRGRAAAPRQPRARSALSRAHADGGREHDRRRRRQHRVDRRAPAGCAWGRAAPAPSRARPATAAAATRRP